jgi:hypothetical protein
MCHCTLNWKVAIELSGHFTKIWCLSHFDTEEM